MRLDTLLSSIIRQPKAKFLKKFKFFWHKMCLLKIKSNCSLANMKFSFVFFVFSVCVFKNVYSQEMVESHEIMYETVKNYVAGHIQTSSEYEINVIPLDSRLNFPACDSALELVNNAPLPQSGRISVNLRCNSPKKWTVLIAAVIKAYDTVLIVTKNLQRGELLTTNVIHLEKRDVSGLHGDYLTQFTDAENKQVTRNLTAGSVLSAKSFIEPKLIKRGDKVTISSEKSSFSVRMNGIAMTDGIKGQLIKVKNESSEKIINATVVDSGLVSVNH